MENKWIRGAIPALLIHCSIGSVYCWSLFKGDIAAEMGLPDTSQIEFAFSLAIFFLGMSAAFAGHFIEKNVKRGVAISTISFVTGLLLTVVSIEMKSVWGLFLSYGCIMGIGLGTGYLSPVKTLMLWFKEHKGIATGIAISGFGLSKVLYSPFIEWCDKMYGVQTTLTCMALTSAVCMGLALYLIHKPKDWVEQMTPLRLDIVKEILMDKDYLKIWFIFYLNITCGLALIAFEKNLGMASGISGGIAMLSALTAFFNTVGRFGYSTWSDYMTDKSKVYKTIFISCIVVCFLGIIAFPADFIYHGDGTPLDDLGWAVLPITVLLLCVINLGYGGGFSTLPTLLESRFGMKRISMIHGFTLSAWAFAGLSGNQLSNLIINKLNGSYNDLLIALGALYLLAFVVICTLKYKPHPDSEKPIEEPGEKEDKRQLTIPLNTQL